MEVKIQIPDNCELIKDGNTYIVKEKKNKPRSWEEFCSNNSLTSNEYYIDNYSVSRATFGKSSRDILKDKNVMCSKQEAEAFLALMQLRQLRKAWVGDWSDTDGAAYSIYVEKGIELSIGRFGVNRVLHFPSLEMAKDFLSCFRDLCETAKILL